MISYKSILLYQEFLYLNSQCCCHKATATIIINSYDKSAIVFPILLYPVFWNFQLFLFFIFLMLNLFIYQEKKLKDLYIGNEFPSFLQEQLEVFHLRTAQFAQVDFWHQEIGGFQLLQVEEDSERNFPIGVPAAQVTKIEAELVFAGCDGIDLKTIIMRKLYELKQYIRAKTVYTS